MKLPIKNFLPKKEKPEYLLALLLRDEKVSAVIVQQFKDSVKVIGQHQEYFTTPLDDLSEEELLEILDRTISAAEESLPPEYETKRTVFGVKDEWVEDKKITKEHLTRLKKISDALELQPIGFLVVSEAVAHLIQEEEGAPLSAILAEIGNTSVNLVLFRGGKVVESQSGTIETSPMHTVDTLLKHFTIEVLPSRLIVFGGKHNYDLAQKFISHQWSKSLPFLHVPQISVLPENFDARSIVFGAATQLNLEVLGEVVDKTGSEIKTYEHGEQVESAPIKESEAKEEEATVLRDEDSDDTDEMDNEDDHKTPPLTGDNFGFVNDEDIATIRPEASHHKSPEHESDTEYEEDSSTNAHSSKTSPLAKLQGLAAVGLVNLKRLPTLLPKRGIPSPKLSNAKLFLIPGAVIILLILLAFLYTANVKSTITLTLDPKVVEQTQLVTLSPDAVNDFAKKTLQASAISSTIEGTVSTPATGKKDVGTKATGTVTLYNNNDTKKTISAGTTITSSNNLDYTLDKDATIASESGDIFSGTKPGTATVTVTAKDIGPEYNLPSGTKFSVAGASNVAAKNDSAFSGGSKKQVTVVSKKDQDKLLSDLPQSLEDKAKSDLSSKVESGQTLLPGFVDESVVSKTFDKKIDDQANTVTLKGKVTFEALTYANNDLTDFATTVLKNNYSQDLHISDKGVQTKIESAKKTDDKTFELNLSIKANLLPTLDTSSISHDLAGKSKKEAEAYLAKLPQVSSSQITFSPAIPLIPQILPHATKNITVVVKSNE